MSLLRESFRCLFRTNRSRLWPNPTASWIRCQASVSRPLSVLVSEETLDVPASVQKEYFNPRRTPEQWRNETDRLLRLKTPWTATDVSRAETVIRWWTFQRTSESVQACMLLYDLIQHQLTEQRVLLDEIKHWYDGNHPRATHLLNAILDSWRIVWESTGLCDNPSRIRYRLMHDYSKEADARSFGLVMAAANSRGKPRTAPDFCESILNYMLDQGVRKPSLFPDTVVCTTILASWAKSGRPDAPLRAMELFREIRQLISERLIDAAPSTVMYNTLIHALVSTLDTSWIEEAERVVDEMRSSADSRGLPNDITFRLVLLAWAGVGSMQRVDHWLSEWIRLDRTGAVLIQATDFSKVISIFAKSKTGFRQAERIYDRLTQLYADTREERHRPEIYAARAMLIVYSKTGRPQEAEGVLQLLEKQAGDNPRLRPKRSHYFDVLMTWVRSKAPDAPARVERILWRMIEANMEPDKHIIDTALRLWMSNPDRSENLLRSLRQHRLGGEVSRSSYLTVMKTVCFSRPENVGERVETLLNELLALDHQKGRPTTEHYALAVSAWGRSKARDSVANMKRIFDLSLEDYESGNEDARPDNTLYSAVLKGFAQHGELDSAEELLQRMWDESCRSSVKVGVSECNLVLLACFRSKNGCKQERVQPLLHWMVERDVQPDERTRQLLSEIACSSPS